MPVAFTLSTYGEHDGANAIMETLARRIVEGMSSVGTFADYALLIADLRRSQSSSACATDAIAYVT